MGTGTLNWYADRGFELDVEATSDDVTIRLSGVPVPADGTVELQAGVELDRIEILFKASVTIQGEIGQLHGARVRLLTADGRDELELDARCEDIETGDVVPVSFTMSIVVPRGAPERGGPKPSPTNEDDLDFEDETTLEQLVVNVPGDADPDEEEPAPARDAGPDRPRQSSGPSARSTAANADKGLQALLRALARIDDDEEGVESEESEPERETRKAGSRSRAVPGGQRAPASVPPKSSRGARALRPPTPTPQQSQRMTEDSEHDAPERSDQSLGAEGEARSLLDMLVDGGNLEVDGKSAVDTLVPGVAKILALPLPSESKATRLSTWLLAQDSVADLFIADDELAEILERW